jgi:hypothetical protein
MTLRIFKLLLIVFCISSSLPVQANDPLPRTNFEQTQSLIKKFAEKIYIELQKFPDSPYSIKCTNHPISQYIEGIRRNSQYIEGILISELSTRNLRFYYSESDTISKLELLVNQFRIEYAKIPDEKNKLKRTIAFSVSALIKRKSLAINPFKFDTLATDTIDVESIGYIERDGSPFKGELPPEKETFFDRYIEPIVVIVSSALVVLLFFSVRSK